MAENTDWGKQRVRAREAYEALAQEIAAVPAEQVLPAHLDIPTVVGTLLAKLPAIRALRPEIVSELPSFDLAQFDRLENLVLALDHAHGAYLVATQPPLSLEQLGAEGAKLRKVFLGDAMAQEGRGVFGEKRVPQLGLGSGPRDLGDDLLALVNLYRNHWRRLEGRTGISIAELEHAEILAEQLVSAADTGDAARKTREDAVEQRERVFALLLRAYDDVRRATLELRTNPEEADGIAPSLDAGGHRAGQPSEPEPFEPPAEAPAPTLRSGDGFARADSK